ncbi:hypothetical protein BDW22DRAFT_1248935 [Trametopsis cervina]|nr:hypothetical protein BDW22DRAFT_1248935 [Trametopsis cervina]
MAKIKSAPHPSLAARRKRWLLAAVEVPERRSKIAARPTPQYAGIDGQRYPISEVFRAFFPFVAERHAIFKKRLAGESAPWTDDPILAKYPFTNVFRVLDRNTQYILRNVIRQGIQDLNETFFRVLLFRTFNKIETWEYLEEELGPLTWSSFDVRKYEDALDNAPGTIYHGAYIIPSPNLGYDRNHRNHLRMIETMMAVDRLPEELSKLRHLRDVHGRIQMYQSMGDFIAMQLVLDLNMMPQYSWSEDEWVALGPGSQACLEKMFGKEIRGHELSAIRFIRDNQHSWFTHCNIRPHEIPRLHTSRPAGLTMVDIEHALCECEKYSRGKFPDIKGKRTNVGKRTFVPRGDPVTADIPDNWLNTAPVIEEDLVCPPPIEGTEDTYEVSHIVNENGDAYLIRWLGYGPEEDSWIRAADLGEGASRLIAKWKMTKARIHDGLQTRAAPGQNVPLKIRRGRMTL